MIALYGMFYRVHYPKLCFFTLLLPSSANLEHRGEAFCNTSGASCHLAITRIRRLRSQRGKWRGGSRTRIWRGLGGLRPTSHKLVVPTPIIISSTSPSFLTDSYRFRCAQRKIYSRLQQNFTNYRLCGRRSKGRSAQLPLRSFEERGPQFNDILTGLGATSTQILSYVS